MTGQRYEVELPSGREVSYRKSKLSDENIILDQELAKNGKNIDKFLSELTGLSVDELKDMYIGDRVYLLIKIRIINKGNIFDPKIGCPFCKKSARYEIDLIDHLENNTKYKDTVEELFDEKDQFVVELPVSKMKLTMKHLTGLEAEKARKEIEKFPGRMLTYLMLSRTVKIENENGEEEMKTSKFFDELDVEDSDHIQEEYDKYDFGVDTAIDCSCKHCSQYFNYEIPFGKDFFLRKSPVKKN
jgi:hypothetical protein